MPTPPIHQRDLQKAADAFQRAGNMAEAARSLKLPESTYKHRYKMAVAAGLLPEKKAAEFHFTPLPDEDVSVEDLIAHRKRQFRQKAAHEEARRLIEVRVKVPGPIGILHFGDPHCLTPDHEILTQRGWLHRQDLRADDLVGGVDERGAFAWQRIARFVDKVVDEPIVQIDSESVSLSCTTQHRVFAAKAVSGGYGPLRYFRAEELNNSQFRIPAAAWSCDNAGVDWSDDEIRLLGWVLTDASWDMRDGVIKAISISQSKPDTAQEIVDLLARLGIAHSTYRRERVGGHVVNGSVVRHNFPENTYRIGLEAVTRWASRLGLTAKDAIPAAAWKMTARQFGVLLETFVKADGERPSRNTVRVCKSHVFLDQLQALCCMFGKKTKIYRQSDAWGTLSIVSQDVGVVKPKYNLETVPYAGPVWCVTVDHGNFFTRRNGRVHITGNCDDDGTDIEALESHTALVNKTEGMFAANVGDTTNNWVGRLAKLYAEQSTSAAQAWKLAEWFVTRCDWLYMLAGNHDAWSGAGDPLKWITRQTQALYQSSEARLGLRFGNGRVVRVNARHDFAGHSQYNPAHGPTKAVLFGVRDHIAISGHRHKSGYGIIKDPDSGIACHAIQVASYKIYDRYARDKGFRDQSLSPCVVTVIDPALPDSHPDMVKVFWSPEEGADFLRWKRSKT